MSSKVKLLATGTVSIYYGWMCLFKKIELMNIYQLKLQPRGQPQGLQPLSGGQATSEPAGNLWVGNLWLDNLWAGNLWAGNLQGQSLEQPPKHFVKPKSLVYFATSNYTN